MLIQFIEGVVRLQDITESLKVVSLGASIPIIVVVVDIVIVVVGVNVDADIGVGGQAIAARGGATISHPLEESREQIKHTAHEVGGALSRIPWIGMVVGRLSIATAICIIAITSIIQWSVKIEQTDLVQVYLEVVVALQGSLVHHAEIGEGVRQIQLNALDEVI